MMGAASPRVLKAPSSPAVRVLFDEATIARRNEAMACEISQRVPPDVLVVAVLKGGFMFAADLVRALHREGVAPQMEFIHLESYGSEMVSRGTVDVVKDIASAVRGRSVLLVDDILESGRTLAFVKERLLVRGAERVWTAVLLDKPGKRAQPFEADFIGFACEDVFVVGYGMDLDHAYRQLPYIGVLKPNLVEKT